MVKSIEIDSSYRHQLNVYYECTNKDFTVECRTGMTSISLEISDICDTYEDKLEDSYHYCDHLCENKKQNFNSLFQELGYCCFEFVSWLEYVKKNLVENKYHHMSNDDIKIIKLVFITGINRIMVALRKIN